MSDEQIENPQESENKRSGLSFSRLFAVIVIIVIIAAAGYFLMNGVGGSVAVINGQKISRAEYDERYAQLATSITSQGGSATTTEMQTAIKNQTLDNLINETLLLQAAEKEGIKSSEEAVEAQFTQNKSSFADEAAFEKALKDQGFTDSTFRKTLIRANIIQQYLAKHININSAVATETEIKALYDQVAANDTSAPPLEQVRTQVQNQIIQQKQQQLIANFIQQLKASSTIETLI